MVKKKLTKKVIKKPIKKVNRPTKKKKVTAAKNRWYTVELAQTDDWYELSGITIIERTGETAFLCVREIVDLMFAMVDTAREEYVKHEIGKVAKEGTATKDDLHIEEKTIDGIKI